MVLVLVQQSNDSGLTNAPIYGLFFPIHCHYDWQHIHIPFINCYLLGNSKLYIMFNLSEIKLPLPLHRCFPSTFHAGCTLVPLVVYQCSRVLSRFSDMIRLIWFYYRTFGVSQCQTESKTSFCFRYFILWHLSLVVIQEFCSKNQHFEIIIIENK